MTFRPIFALFIACFLAVAFCYLIRRSEKKFVKKKQPPTISKRLSQPLKVDWPSYPWKADLRWCCWASGGKRKFQVCLYSVSFFFWNLPVRRVCLRQKREVWKHWLNINFHVDSWIFLFFKFSFFQFCPDMYRVRAPISKLQISSTRPWRHTFLCLATCSCRPIVFPSPFPLGTWNFLGSSLLLPRLGGGATGVFAPPTKRGGSTGEAGHCLLSVHHQDRPLANEQEWRQRANLNSGLHAVLVRVCRLDHNAKSPSF